MKSKKHNKHVREKVVENSKVGLGFKTISQAFNTLHTSVKLVIHKWKEFGTTGNPSNQSCLQAGLGDH